MQVSVYRPNLKIVRYKLYNYFVNLRTFTGLKELNLSFTPEQIPSHVDDDNSWTIRMSGRGIEDTADESPLLQALAEAFLTLRKEIPPGCKVTWKFDKTSMPSMAGPTGAGHTRDTRPVALHLEEIHEGLDKSWHADDVIFEEMRKQTLERWSTPRYVPPSPMPDSTDS